MIAILPEYDCDWNEEPTSSGRHATAATQNRIVLADRLAPKQRSRFLKAARYARQTSAAFAGIHRRHRKVAQDS